MKKMKLIAVALMATLILSGCGWFDRKYASVTGGATKSCIDGVVYLQFTSGATVQVDKEGMPVTCG